jgi:hypothetical protein
MPIERKPLQKAPSRDVVDAFTAPTPETEQEPSEATVRRGPGRPRSKRRMEPFSSKIEMNLRDEVDAYINEHGGSIVDFLDEAFRDRLQK